MKVSKNPTTSPIPTASPKESPSLDLRRSGLFSAFAQPNVMVRDNLTCASPEDLNQFKPFNRFKQFKSFKARLPN